MNQHPEQIVIQRDQPNLMLQHQGHDSQYIRIDECQLDVFYQQPIQASLLSTTTYAIQKETLINATKMQNCAKRSYRRCVIIFTFFVLLLISTVVTIILVFIRQKTGKSDTNVIIRKTV